MAVFFSKTVSTALGPSTLQPGCWVFRRGFAGFSFSELAAGTPCSLFFSVVAGTPLPPNNVIVRDDVMGEGRLKASRSKQSKGAVGKVG